MLLLKGTAIQYLCNTWELITPLLYKPPKYFFQNERCIMFFLFSSVYYKRL